MYAKSYKLYPFSKKNLAPLMVYADKLWDDSERAEARGDWEHADKLRSKSIHIGNFSTGGLHGVEEEKIVWLTGKDIGEVKKLLAMIA